jgi:VanZ family protein
MISRLQNVDWGKLGKNLIYFTAPALVVLFYQLSQGANFKVAVGMATLVVYGILADFFRKYQSTKDVDTL